MTSLILKTLDEFIFINLSCSSNKSIHKTKGQNKSVLRDVCSFTLNGLLNSYNLGLRKSKSKTLICGHGLTLSFQSIKVSFVYDIL